GGPTARLMLMFAYLCTRSTGWQNTKLRVLTEAEKYSKEQVQQSFSTYLENVRIEAEIEALDKVDFDIIERYSGQSDLVFFPVEVRENDVVDSFAIGLQQLTETMNNLVLVQACQAMQLDPDPDKAHGAKPD
ncbi:hypothetical protein, partial [Arsukibacterium sp.]|uniref:hypothetical protein n=1 Tax=Arsukibacterium sp. TaxID=1977258 RepID=UPI00299F4A16